MQVAGKLKPWNGKSLWGGAPEEGRRAYVMPYGDEHFIAFGIQAPPGTVRFVITGSMEKEMDSFIELMNREKAAVTVVPLPYDTQQVEPPPGTGVRGYFRERATQAQAGKKGGGKPARRRPGAQVASRRGRA